MPTRLIRRFLTIFILFLATGCGSGNERSFSANTQQSSAGWRIQYSPSMPADPTAGGPGIWYLNFPSDPNYPACVATSTCESLNYVTNLYSGQAANSVSMTFQIITTGEPAFHGALDPDNNCSTPATVRLFLERKNDDFSQEFYRWWANPTSYALQATPGDVTLSVPLTPGQWSSVFGKFGNHDAAALAGFQDALTNLGRVGMTFGGGCFFGHGVNVTGGTARFVLVDYTIS